MRKTKKYLALLLSVCLLLSSSSVSAFAEGGEPESKPRTHGEEIINTTGGAITAGGSTCFGTGIHHPQADNSVMAVENAISAGNPETHEWGEGIVTKKATCVEAGTITYTCVCGESKTEEIQIDPSNHEYGAEILNAMAATCITEGYTGDTYCLGCGDIVEKGTITGLDAGNHEGETEVRNAVDATCITEGYTGDTYCLGCDDIVETGTNTGLDAGSHEGETEVRSAVDATCITEGYTGDTYCLGCDMKISDGEVIDRLAHTEEEILAVAAKCETAGSTAGVKCSVCGEILTAPEPVNPLGHDFTGGFVTGETTHWQVCAREGCDVSDAAAEHIFGGWIVDAAAAAGAAGSQHRNCSVCGCTQTEEISAPAAASGGGTAAPAAAPEEVEIENPDVPLAGGPELNKADHIAYISGYADGTVRPDNYLTREEVATIFYRLLTDQSRAVYETGENSFSDVDAERWSNTAISTLANAGIITDYADGTFRPANSVTRAELTAMAARFDDVTDGADNPFSDTEGHWAKDLISFAASKGWVNGYADGTFRPDAPITRAEAMKLINQVLGRQVDAEGLPENVRQWPDNDAGKWYYTVVLEATTTHGYERRSDDSITEIWLVLPGSAAALSMQDEQPL